MRRVFLFALALSLTCACGTYSQIRTGKTLPAGAVEVNGGAAVNGLSEVAPVAQAAVGITDWLELVAHWELWNGYGELRLGVLKEDAHLVNVAVGAGGGFGVVVGQELLLDSDDETDGLLTGSVALSRSIGDYVEIYASGRAMWFPPEGSVLTGRGGLRVGNEYVHVFGEGGVSSHAGFAVGEATAGIGFAFGKKPASR